MCSECDYVECKDCCTEEVLGDYEGNDNKVDFLCFLEQWIDELKQRG